MYLLIYAAHFIFNGTFIILSIYPQDVKPESRLKRAYKFLLVMIGQIC